VDRLTFILSPSKKVIFIRNFLIRRVQVHNSEKAQELMMNYGLYTENCKRFLSEMNKIYKFRKIFLNVRGFFKNIGN